MKGLRGRLLRVNLADHSYEVEQIPDDVARKCLALLFRDAGPGYREKVHGRKTDRMNGHIPVFVNSREARSPRGPDTHPEPGDTVTIMPPHGRRLRERQSPGRC